MIRIFRKLAARTSREGRLGLRLLCWKYIGANRVGSTNLNPAGTPNLEGVGIRV